MAQGNSSPPGLKSEKDWFVSEDEAIGTVVTRLVTFNERNNSVNFLLQPNMEGETIHTYFTVDDQRRVVVAKNLSDLVSVDIV